MAGSGPGTGEWAEVTKASVPLFEDAARLQAVAGALTAAAHAGPCGDTRDCATAMAAPATAYPFPSDPAVGEAALLCDLAARSTSTSPPPLGRLAAAEYRCCSFGSCTIVIDGTGLRLELRMPVEAAGTIAAGRLSRIAAASPSRRPTAPAR